MGYVTTGSGQHGVIVLNDWMGDTTTWDPAKPYLDPTSFTWVFADLRGYGRSIDHAGDYTVTEGAADVLELATALGWQRFSIVGHSMSSLVALHLAQHHAARIERAVVLNPVPPTGLVVPQAIIDQLQALARGDDALRLSGLKFSWGDRLTEQWVRFKASRWRATANAEAVAAYVLMYARDGLPDPTATIAAPILAVTCDKDAEIMRRDVVTGFLTPICPKLVVASIADSGHYPMQEVPPLLVATLERFLASP